jgi:HEAT repeat protein
MEMLSRSDPLSIDRAELLELVGDGPWVIRMLVLRMLGRLRWEGDEVQLVRAFVLAQLQDPNTFVRAWALDALACLAVGDETLVPVASEAIAEALTAGPASVRVRARYAASRLGPGPQPRPARRAVP